MGDGKPSRFRAEVEIIGLDTTEAFIKEMGDRAFDTLVLMEQMTEELEIASRARLAKAPWAPLTEATIARKDSQGEDTSIMHDEWRPIKGAPTRQGNALWIALNGGEGSFRKATRTQATYGVNTAGQAKLFYGRMVQNVKGTKRKLLAIPEEYAIGMVELTVRYILGITTFSSSGSKTMPIFSEGGATSTGAGFVKE